MLRALVLTLALLLAAVPARAQIPPVAETVIGQLRAQGYEQIEITRTFLGRLRIEAQGPDGTREIVLNPRTGLILRDTLYFDDPDEDDDEDGLFGPSSGGGGAESGRGQEEDDGNRDDDDDEDHGDDDDDDDDDDAEDDDGGDDDDDDDDDGDDDGDDD
ncbi:MAG: hypothetical protein AAF376_19520 [Pseudomonadota bacterium]